MDPEVRERYLAIGLQPSYFRAVREEGAVIQESDEQVRNTGSLEDIPLTVISHDVPDMFESLNDEQAEQAEQVWQEGQRALAQLSSDSTHLVAEDAGHNIQFDRPALIVQSIRDLSNASIDPDSKFRWRGDTL